MPKTRPPAVIGRGRAWLVATLVVMLTTSVGAGSSPDGDTVAGFRHFKRGDVNADGGVNLPDSIVLLDYLFVGGAEPPCLDAADTDDDEALGLADPLYLLNYSFGGGPQPPVPFFDCGPDPTLNIAISCESYPPCDAFADIDQAGHLMRRLGFGPTPQGISHILDIGVDSYLDEQLFPELLDESGNLIMNDLLATLTPDSDLLSLVLYQVVRAYYSERQLQEALTDFWENHFNTQFGTSQQFLQNVRAPGGVTVYTPQEARALTCDWEFTENSILRFGALGSFLDLLVASATGRTMIVYLDTFSNVADSPNENYARELLELHTMGVDNGYLQEDIEEVARCFTGWRICKKDPLDVDDPFAPCLPNDDPNGIWAFTFVPFLHDYESKTIFAGTSYQLVIPARTPGSPEGILDGFEVLQHLVTLPQTAEFVSTKLIQRLVNDEAPPALVADCLTAWLATDGDLRSVVSVIVHSDEFLGTDNRWTKMYTPFEVVMALGRSVGAITSGGPLIFGVGGNPGTGLLGLDYIPFFYETPEGRSEFGFDWMGSTNLLNRILHGNLLALSIIDPVFDPVQVMVDEGVVLNDEVAIAEFWLTRAFQNFYSLEERELSIQFLESNEDGTVVPLDPSSPDYDQRIRAFIGYVLSAPQAQKQ